MADGVTLLPDPPEGYFWRVKPDRWYVPGEAVWLQLRRERRFMGIRWSTVKYKTSVNLMPRTYTGRDQAQRVRQEAYRLLRKLDGQLPSEVQELIGDHK